MVDIAYEAYCYNYCYNYYNYFQLIATTKLSFLNYLSHEKNKVSFIFITMFERCASYICNDMELNYGIVYLLIKSSSLSWVVACSYATYSEISFDLKIHCLDWGQVSQAVCWQRCFIKKRAQILKQRKRN